MRLTAPCSVQLIRKTFLNKEFEFLTRNWHTQHTPQTNYHTEHRDLNWVCQAKRGILRILQRNACSSLCSLSDPSQFHAQLLETKLHTNNPLNLPSCQVSLNLEVPVILDLFGTCYFFITKAAEPFFTPELLKHCLWKCIHSKDRTDPWTGKIWQALLHLRIWISSQVSLNQR